MSVRESAWIGPGRSVGQIVVAPDSGSWRDVAFEAVTKAHREPASDPFSRGNHERQLTNATGWCRRTGLQNALDLESVTYGS